MISINPLTYVIYVPKADLTLIQASPEVRELNVNSFRMWLKDYEDDPDYGIYLYKTHNHNTEVQLAGLTYARIIEILSPYTVEFENGSYTVNCVGANHNISDVKVPNSVSLIVNNAAGLISNAQIEYASFNGAVTLDPNSSFSGTLYPVGTPQMPVNNMEDALLIANVRGFTKLFLKDDLVLDDLYNLDGFRIEGLSSEVELNINSIASVNDLSVSNLTLASSTLDGGVEVKNCVVRDITYLNGTVESCGLAGTISLGGNRKSVINNCYTVDMDDPPIIDMGGSGNDIAMPNYSGLATIRNLSSASNEIGIGLTAGSVTLDSTISAGLVIISGIGMIIDNSTGTAMVNTDGLINKSQISQAVWDEPISDHLTVGTTGLSVGIQQFNGQVTIDVISGQTGTTFPIGTDRVPVNNIPDAVSIAATRGINRFNVIGSLTASGGPFTGYHISGENVQDTLITASDLDCQGVTFENCKITGNFINDSYITTLGCVLEDVTDIEITAWNTSFGGFVRLIDGSQGKSVFYNCFDDIPGIGIPDIRVNTCLNLGIWNFNGGIRLSNITQAATVVSLMIAQGRLWVDDTCVAGDIIVKGLADLRGETNGTTIDSEGLITLNTISEGVWSYNAPSTAVAGSFGEIVQKSLGLMQENYVLDQTVYDGNSNLTSARIRTYLDSAKTQLLATYLVSATFTGNQMQTYQVIKQ